MDYDEDEIRQEFEYLQEYVFTYLKVVNPTMAYYMKQKDLSFIFINAPNYLLCEKKDFTDSVFFADVEVTWNQIQFFPVIKKDVFKKLNALSLREHISTNLASMIEIKRLLKLPKSSD